LEKNLHIQLIQKGIENALSTKLKLEVEYLSNCCCAECLKLNGVRIPIEEIDINNPPVPVKNCRRNGGCNCTLLFIP